MEIQERLSCIVTDLFHIHISHVRYFCLLSDFKMLPIFHTFHSPISHSGIKGRVLSPHWKNKVNEARRDKIGLSKHTVTPDYRCENNVWIIY